MSYPIDAWRVGTSEVHGAVYAERSQGAHNEEPVVILRSAAGLETGMQLYGMTGVLRSWAEFTADDGQMVPVELELSWDHGEPLLRMRVDAADVRPKVTHDHNYLSTVGAGEAHRDPLEGLRTVFGGAKRSLEAAEEPTPAGIEPAED